MDKKIIQKGRGTPKVYKSGKAGEAGWPRLRTRTYRLILDLERFGAKHQGTPEGAAALALASRVRFILTGRN